MSDVIQGPVHLPLRIDGQVVPYRLWLYTIGQKRWIAASTGDVAGDEPVLLRIESACVFGHILHSAKCDCGYQLDEALRRIGALGRGIIIYGVDDDARGLGIEAHFQIYVLRQQRQLDTEAVYAKLGAPVDARSYEAVAFILRDLGVRAVRLLSNNPKRKDFLISHGISVLTEPLEAPLDRHNMGTLMLEKEDLDYTWKFKTHSDWLTPLQAQIDGDIELNAAEVVDASENTVAKCFDRDWNIARRLRDEWQPNYSSGGGFVIYLSDFPRVDELPLYRDLGITVLVLPYAQIPEWLRAAGEIAHLIVQDWARKNKYQHPRSQWQLVGQKEGGDIYYRNGLLRCVFPHEVETLSKTNKIRQMEKLQTQVKSVLGDNCPLIARIETHRCAWAEFGQLAQDQWERLMANGLDCLKLSVPGCHGPFFIPNDILAK
jgi:GTP cyclohydrolase II